MNAVLDVPVHAIPAMFGTPLRAKWDDNVESAEWHQIIKDDKTDAVLRVVIKPPMILSKREAFFRRVIATNFPEEGCITIVGVDGSANQPLANGMVRASMKMLNVVARPV